MQHNPIGWVEIPVVDLDRAERFYRDYFGFELTRQEERFGVTMSWFPMKMDSYGSAATLIQGEGYIPSHEGSLIYFTAPEESVAKAVEKAKQCNITVLQELVSLGEHGFYAVLEDSEGNRIAIHSMKE